MPGAQKNGKNNAVTTETLIKAPTMKSRQRPFCIISSLQLLHFILLFRNLLSNRFLHLCLLPLDELFHLTPCFCDVLMQ